MLFWLQKYEKLLNLPSFYLVESMKIANFAEMCENIQKIK